MKRDLDLIREILLQIEAKNSNSSYELYPESMDFDENEMAKVSFHIRLLLDNNFLDAKKFEIDGDPYEMFKEVRITNSGYDYLDNIRNEKIWGNVKDKLQEVGGAASLAVIKILADKLISGSL